VLTPFFWKKGSKGIEAADEKQSTIGRLKEEDDQQDSPVVRGIQP
jgi:hypothetical protein